MKLVVGEDGGGLRHFLNGKPVSCGTQLRLRISDGPEQWAWARYEAGFYKDEIRAILYTVFGIVIPNEDTFLRWPTEAER